ncbi:MAG TPA: hypothetical protein VGH89_14945 [Pseudonocardia sp.]|jgi:hypothetical protein
MIAPGPPRPIGTGGGTDTDHDGRPDTVRLPDPVTPSFAIDLDRDGAADLVVRIGPDAHVDRIPLDPAGLGPSSHLGPPGVCIGDGSDLGRAGEGINGVHISDMRIGGLDLPNLNVAGTDVAGIDLAGIDLAGADIAGADPVGTDLGWPG